MIKWIGCSVVRLFAELQLAEYLRMTYFRIEQKRPGVDVMITIFCDFFPIFQRQNGVFLKNQYYEQIFVKTISSLN
jgi:hypothetical protein